MKCRKLMNHWCAVGALVAFAAGAARADVTDSAELLSGGSWAVNAFTQAQYWGDYGTTTPLGGTEALPSDRDYLVRSGRGLRTPNVVQPFTFAGKSLTLGEVNGTSDTAGDLIFYSYDNGIGTFPDPGLTLAKGSLTVRTGYNHPTYLAGTLTIASKTEENGIFKTQYTNTVLQVRSLVHFASDCWAKIINGVAYPTGLWTHGPFTCEFTNESSDFNGSLHVCATGLGGTLGGDPLTILGLCSVSMNVLKLDAYTRLRPVAADDVITVKTLTLADGAQLEVKASYSGTTKAAFVATNSLIVATDALNLPASGKVYLSLPRVLNKFDGTTDKVAILKGPAGSIDVDKFEMLPISGEAIYDYTLVTSDEKDVLYVQTVSAALLLRSDEGGATQGTGTYSTLAGDRWSTGEAPKAGVHYLVYRFDGNAKVIRSQGATFAGESLTVENSTVYIFQHGQSYFKVLRLLSGVVVSQRGGSWTDLQAGRIEVPCGTVQFQYHSSRQLRLNGPLVGAATIYFRGVDGTSSPKAEYQLYVANPNFTGRILASKPDTWPATSPFDGYHSIYTVCQPSAIGGPLSAFDPKAFTLGNYGEVVLNFAYKMGKNTDMQFTDLTRGFYFDSAVALTVPSGKTGTFLSQRTFDGELFLCGEGTKAFGGAVKFASGSSIVDTPTAGKNRMTLVNGDIKALSSTCMDGLVVTFSNETSRIVLDADTTDAALASNGVVNVKTATPFVLKGETLNFHLALNDSTAKKYPVELGLVTVSSAAAEQLRGHIAVTTDTGVVSKSRLTVLEKTDAETGSVTFYLQLRKGLAVFLR